MKSGETLTVDTVVHYKGPSDLEILSFNVSLYVDHVLIEKVTITDLSPTNPSVPVQLQWKVDTKVPYSDQVSSRLIKVSIEIPDGFEFDVGTTRFSDNNTLKTEVSIELKDQGDPSLFSTSSRLVMVGFFAGIPLLIIVIVLGVIYIKRKKKKGEEREEELEE